MPQDGDSCYEESFNSFLAGVLLIRRRINNFEFFNLMNSFSNTYNVDIVSVGDEINVPIYLDDTEIKLLINIEDTIMINGRNVVIGEYLYSITTSRVREFFGIPDLKSKIENNQMDTSRKFRPFVRSLFKKKIAI